jgi:hypothetical protein
MSLQVLSSFCDSRIYHFIGGTLVYPSEAIGHSSNIVMTNLESYTVAEFELFPTQCRENTMIHLIETLHAITKPGKLPKKDNSGYKKASMFPDWSDYSTAIFIGGQKGPAEDFQYLLRNFAGHVLAELFGDIAYDIHTETDTVSVRNYLYGQTGRHDAKCELIRFPNCFMSSPAALSLFLNSVRKALCFFTHMNDESIRKGIKEIGYYDESFETLKPALRELHHQGRDPFRPAERSYYLVDYFPLEFFEFITKVKPKYRDAVFGQENWDEVFLGVYGYRMSVYNAYCESYGEMRRDFAEYLYELGHEGTIKVLRNRNPRTS